MKTAMMLCYYPDTDMLYIELVRGVSTESEEVAPGIVLDFNAQNQVIGIEIEDAHTRIDLSRLEVSALPLVDLIFSTTASGQHRAMAEEDTHSS